MTVNYSSSSSVSSTESSSTADRLPRSKNEESYFYQQIGAPTFLYNHDNSTKDAAEYFPSIEDSYHSWKPWDVNLDDLGIVQIRDYANYITETLSQANRARLIHNFPGSLGRAYGNLPYIKDSNYGESNYSSCLYMAGDDEIITARYIQQQANIEMKKRRSDISFGNSFPLSKYCAPFTEHEVRNALGGGETSLLHMTQKEQKQFKQIHGLDRRNIQDQPQFYGNNLKLLPCNCQYCQGKNKKGSPSCALLFSKGQSVSVNPIHLPQKYSSNADHGLSRQVDVEANVMQIESCCDVRDISTLPNETLQIVRTSRDVSILLCEAVDDEDHTSCTRDYTLSFIASLDYHMESAPLMPIDIATRQYNSTLHGGTIPTFATVCKSSEDLVFGARGPNTIHYTTCGGKNYSKIQTKRHSIDNLSSISQIEFSGLHPLVLWSAARSSTQQPLIKGQVHWKRPQLGYGHSLHSIDLRSNKANFVWSPSNDEFVPGGLHSVCSIFQESHKNPHSLYVSTASAEGKVYHIDARMPSRTICSWSMGGMLDEDNIINSSTGIYGAGSILTTPLIMTEQGIEDSLLPIINGKKEPNAKGFSMHHRPKQAGLFHTKNLESVASTTKELDVLGTFSKTSFHPFPTSSTSKFTTGLASFYTDMPSILTTESMDSNGFDKESQKALCVITTDSRGDILSHTFAVCGEDEELQVKGIRDAPLGTTSVSLKGGTETKQKSSSNVLSWQLSNLYTTNTKTKTIEEDLPPSQYEIVDVSKTSTRNVPQTNKCRQNFISYQQGDFVYGSLTFKKANLELPLVYHNPIDPCDDRPLKKRKYKIKEPSENIIEIIAEIRKKRAPKIRLNNENPSISSKIFERNEFSFAKDTAG